MTRPYYVVDAFAAGPFTGNPAAVVLECAGLEDRAMQAIANEFNLSETTFVLPATPIVDADLRFRWFTPAVEVSMCGHATVAGVHALIESGRLAYEPHAPQTRLRIETMSGVITAFVEPWPGEPSARMIWLELIPPSFSEAGIGKEELAPLLGLTADALEPSLPIARTNDDDLLVFVRDSITLNGANPDFRRLAEFSANLQVRGLCVATVKTLTPSINVHSRFFAPAAGVNEDPVTGSVHGPLAAYLVKRGLVPIHDAVAGMTCLQGIPGGRTGVVYALVNRESEDRFQVRVGGRAVTTMHGMLMC